MYLRRFRLRRSFLKSSSFRGCQGPLTLHLLTFSFRVTLTYPGKKMLRSVHECKQTQFQISVTKNDESLKSLQKYMLKCCKTRCLKMNIAGYFPCCKWSSFGIYLMFKNNVQNSFNLSFQENMYAPHFILLSFKHQKSSVILDHPV